MALLGLGFSFGAKDDGLSAQLGKLNKDFKSLGKEILGLQRLQTFLSALSFDRLDQMTNKLSSFSSSGMNLTSSLESQFQSMDISARKMGVNLGKSASEIKGFSKQVANMSLRLGIGADEAGKAVAGFEYIAKNKELQAGFKTLGIESADALAKFSEQLGIDPYDFSYRLELMQKDLGLTGKDLADIIAQAKAYGKENGTVGESIKSVVDMQNLMLRQKNVFGKTPEQAAAFAKSTYELGTALQKSGVEHGLDMSKELAEKMTMNAEDFSKLTAGVQSDLPDLIKSLAITGVSTEDVMGSLRKGPSEFVNAIGRMVDEADKSGKSIAPAMDFFRKQMAGTLGPKLTNELVNAFKDRNTRQTILAETGGKALVKATQETAGDVVKTWRDSRTSAQLFEQQQELFLQRFRNMSTQTSASFVKESGKSFNDFGKMVERIHKDGGPLSLLLGKMADVQKFGMAGIFPPDMQAQMVVAGASIESLISPLAKLRAAGINLLNPMGALAAAFGFLGARFVALYAKSGSASKAMDALFEEVVKKGEQIRDFLKTTLPNIFKKAVKWLADAARNFLQGGIRAGTKAARLQKLGGEILDAIVEGLKGAWNFLVDTFKGLWQGLIGGAVDERNDGQVIGLAIGRMLRNAFVFAWNFISNYVTNWWNDVIAIWTDPSLSLGDRIGKTLTRSIGIIIAAVALAFSPLAPILTGALTVVADAVMVVVSALGWWLIPIALAVIGITKALSKEGESFGETWVRVFQEQIVPFFDGMYRGFLDFKDRILAPLMAGVNSLKDAFSKLFTALSGAFQSTTIDAADAGHSVGAFLGQIAEAVAKVLGGVMQFIADITTGIANFVANNKDFLKQVLAVGAALFTVLQVVEWITAAVAFLPEALGALAIGFFIAPDATQKLVDGISGAVETAMKAVGKVVGNGLAALWKMFGGTGSDMGSLLLSALVNPWGAFIAVGAKALDWIFGFIGRLAPAIGTAVKSILNLIQGAINGVLTGVRDALMSAFPEAAGVIFKIFGAIQTNMSIVFDTLRLGIDNLVGAVQTIALIFQRVFGTIYNIVTTVIDLVVQWTLKAFSWLSEKAGAIASWIYNLAPGFFDTIGKLFDAVSSAISSGWDFLKSNIGKFWDWIKSKVNSFFDMIDSVILSIGEKLLPEDVVKARKVAKEARDKEAADEKRKAEAAATGAKTGLSAADLAKMRETILADTKRTLAVTTDEAKRADLINKAKANADARAAGITAADIDKIAAETAPKALEAKLPKMDFKMPKTALSPKALGIPEVAPGTTATPTTPTVAPAATSSLAGRLPTTDNLDRLIEATNNPTWTNAYLGQLERRHQEVLTELRRITSASPTEVGGAARPAQPRPVINAASPRVPSGP